MNIPVNFLFGKKKALFSMQVTRAGLALKLAI